MASPITRRSTRLFLVLALLGGLNVYASSSDDLLRIDSDVDESSCICGLNRAILDQLERIVRESASVQSCPAVNTLEDSRTESENPSSLLISSQELHEADRPNEHSLEPEMSGADKYVFKRPAGDHSDRPTGGSNQDDQLEEPSKQGSNHDVPFSTHAKEPTVGSSQGGSSGEHTEEPTVGADQGAASSIQPGSIVEDPESLIAKLSAEIHRLESQITGTRPPNHPGGSSTPTTTSTHFSSSSSTSHETSAPTTSSSSFLNQMADQQTPANNEALMQLSNNQKVDPQTMASALELTVPNIVSSIFASIQSLVVQTEQHEQSSSSSDPSKQTQPTDGVLTSIDGSTMNVPSSSTVSEITADGERLFQQWLDHQLAGLHLTASVANSIRRNAISLFARIVRQYVNRVAKLGGSVEENVRKATQMALYNTQNLTSYVLRNYVNFAAGLLQILGEQVSRIGKRLDSSGQTIAHMSLNPFDIVSDVIESLPNPSDYSKYFRAFGKQLLGGGSSSSSSGGSGSSESIGDVDQQQEQQTEEADRQKGGLIKKTMGALSKTLGNLWLG